MSNGGAWSVFHCEISGSCLAGFLLKVHSVRVGVSHLQEVQSSSCVACRERETKLSSRNAEKFFEFPLLQKCPAHRKLSLVAQNLHCPAQNLQEETEVLTVISFSTTRCGLTTHEFNVCREKNSLWRRRVGEQFDSLRRETGRAEG